MGLQSAAAALWLQRLHRELVLLLLLLCTPPLDGPCMSTTTVAPYKVTALTADCLFCRNPRRRDVSHGSFSNGDEPSSVGISGTSSPNGTLPRYQAPALQHRGTALDGIEEASALLAENRGPGTSGRLPSSSLPPGAAGAAGGAGAAGLVRAGSGAGRMAKQLGSWWNEFDSSVMRPLFGGPGQGPGEGDLRRGSESPT